MINLTDVLLVSKGSERACYIHPLDNKKIIKVIFHSKSSNDQNLVEYKYYNYLLKNLENYTHITRCYDWVNTNIGEGLVFDRICDFNGQNSKQLTYYLKNKLLSIECLNLLLNDLKKYLFKNNILFLDVATLNVLCQEISENKFKLVIIDGLGPKKNDYKFVLYKYLPFYLKYKIYKQWSIFINLVNRVKRSN